MGFGKEELYHPTDYNRTWKKKPFGMMKEFMEEKKIKVVEPKWGMPEFTIYSDYWEDWITGGYNAFIGGQQSELWESMAENRCAEGIRIMMREIENRNKTKC
jgi:hypothetical protein